MLNRMHPARLSLLEGPVPTQGYSKGLSLLEGPNLSNLLTIFAYRRTELLELQAHGCIGIGLFLLEGIVRHE